MRDLSQYFDFAAATPVLPEVISAMEPYFGDKFYNPSALYLDSRQNREDLENARHTIAQGLGAKPTEIIFTAGGSEANNLAIKGLGYAHKSCHMVASAVDHKSVLEPIKNFDNSICKVDKKGFVDLVDLKKCINDQTVLVSIVYANNEIGVIQQLNEVNKILGEIRKDRQARNNKLPIYLHSDGCQATNYLDMQVSKLAVDLMTINSDKIYGPRQCGALYIKTGINLKPLIEGGGQERWLRSGTENLASIIGFAKAFKIVRTNYHDETARLTALRDEFIKYIINNHPKCILNGPTDKKRLANNINLTFPNKDAEILLMQLDELGYKIATSSACSASNQEASHVLKAIGLSKHQAKSTIRITLGRYTSKKSLFEFADCLLKLLA